MAHVFPKRRFKSGEALGTEEINANFRPYLNEVQGKLNEHNFDIQAFVDHEYGGEIDAGAVYEIHMTGQSVNHGFNDTDDAPYTVIGNGPKPQPSNRFTIEQTQTWQEVDDMSITVTTDNCVAWIQASFQLTTIRDPDFAGSSASAFQTAVPNVWPHPGIQCAISIDGSIIPETITGSLEKSNDHTGEGLAHYANGIVVDTIMSLPAGSHIFALKVRVAADPFYERRVSLYSVLTTGDSLGFWIGSRSLTVLEMK